MKGQPGDQAEEPEDGCLVHGLSKHVRVHEAGHALAAIDFSVPFSRIVLLAPQLDAAPFVFPAEIVMPTKAQVWVNADRRAALKFLAAGQVAEAVVLGDIYTDSALADWATFRAGVGASAEALTDAEFDALVGPPGLDMLGDQVEEWAIGRADRIEQYAEFLATCGMSEVTWEQTLAFAGEAGWL